MQKQKQKPQNQTTNMNKSSSRNSESSPQIFHSPKSYHDSPPYQSPENFPDNSRAIVIYDKFTNSSSNLLPPAPSQHHQSTSDSVLSAKPPSLVLTTINRSSREEPPPSVTKLGPATVASGGEDAVGGRSRTVGRSTKEDTLKKAALGFRLSEVVLCMISFSVMAADKTQGWSGDSFDRYKEYRYCLSVNIIAFVYSGFQAYDLAYHLATGKHVAQHHFRYHFDFIIDQILAYLLVSASSSAATRVDDWQSNWGKDEFTEMASASVAMSFLAFIAFAFSSLISGYNFCTCGSG